MVWISPHSPVYVSRAASLQHIVSASVMYEVSWSWQIYSKTHRWLLSDTKVNFQSPTGGFKL